MNPKDFIWNWAMKAILFYHCKADFFQTLWKQEYDCNK